ncbi:nitroreductase family protein [Candidatus Galacturonibacter soehngenii]|uniref:Nitroreductase family protein n=1 Tax=Candidatus Galacturonatibacter soehngenii TaxID=2307010 RepID=A0A7V7QMR5_9FIRM|nr:nitroreductase family protein [Candidatus Galacturonibacter soehngenii]KAB1440035.1 nitroreductase family protein [Candidatus Galacturonibacter soehngenii]MBA4686142.1 nitroreductase family protein [Candidatus Galacturonibacter soehngenii]
MFQDLVKKSRSYRRFYEEKEITMEQLKQLVELARLSPSGANRQPLKYVLSASREKNKEIFDTLAWAGYLKDWDGPIEGERPSAYIIMLRDKSISKAMSIDEGICAQSMFLGASDLGFGGCFIGAINKPKLMKVLDLGEEYEIALVIALGYPKEEVVLETLNTNEDIKYYRDEEGVHHVPKRSLKDLIVQYLDN